MYLQLSQSEATASTDPAVVLDGRASHNRSELVDRTGCKGGSLSLASHASRGLLAGLYCRLHVRFNSHRFPGPSSVAQSTTPLLLFRGRRNSGLGSGCPLRSIPGRSGIEPDVASPFGSLVAISVSIFDDRSCCIFAPSCAKLALESCEVRETNGS